MGKRANPFVEDFVPQSKTHVGLKQFNNNEDRLQKVYEKTLELLFKGAKKQSIQEIPANREDAIVNKKDNMKQLCIGKDGLISHTEVAVLHQSQSLQCGNCSKELESQCTYCEKSLCSSCQLVCSRCQNTYCSHCSLIGSEGVQVCVSCYG